jgi:hypothetical protein
MSTSTANRGVMGAAMLILLLLKLGKETVCFQHIAAYWSRASLNLRQPERANELYFTTPESLGGPQ